MADLDLAALRAKAEAATPGPWTQDGHHMSLIIKCIAERGSPNARHLCGDYINVADAGENWMVDAPFIAAANPAVVLAILDRVEKAEAQADLLEGAQEENSRLRALLERAGEALRPFAATAENDIGGDETDLDRFRPMTAHAIAPAILVGDLRTARTIAREIEEIANG